MRHILALISCVALFFAIKAQSPDANKRTCGEYRPASSLPKPIFVIDGVVKDEFDLKKIDPNNIDRIEILKEAEFTTLYCNRPAGGVIIVTTKTAKQKTICVKDFLTGQAVPNVTIDLVPITSRNEAIHLFADSVGRVISDRIINDNQYELKISSIGYQNFSAIVNSKQITNDYTVFLAREYKTLGEVIVTATNCPVVRRVIGCGRPVSPSHTQCMCLSKGLTIKMPPEVQKKEEQLSGFKLYPNPALRSQKINVELISKNEEMLTLRLFGLDGKQINSSEHQASKGLNRFEYMIDSKLASGTYMMQITGANGDLVKSEKLVVQ